MKPKVIIRPTWRILIVKHTDNIDNRMWKTQNRVQYDKNKA